MSETTTESISSDDFQSSPLSEATPDSVDNLLDEMNNNLIEGMPERITAEKLEALVKLYRAQAEKWATMEAEKKPRQKRGQAKTTKELTTAKAIELDLDSL